MCIYCCIAGVLRFWCLAFSWCSFIFFVVGVWVICLGCGVGLVSFVYLSVVSP